MAYLTENCVKYARISRQRFSAMQKDLKGTISAKFSIFHPLDLQLFETIFDAFQVRLAPGIQQSLVHSFNIVLHIEELWAKAKKLKKKLLQEKYDDNWQCI